MPHWRRWLPGYPPKIGVPSSRGCVATHVSHYLSKPRRVETTLFRLDSRMKWTDFRVKVARKRLLFKVGNYRFGSGYDGTPFRVRRRKAVVEVSLPGSSRSSPSAGEPLRTLRPNGSGRWPYTQQVPKRVGSHPVTLVVDPAMTCNPSWIKPPLWPAPCAVFCSYRLGAGAYRALPVSRSLALSRRSARCRLPTPAPHPSAGRQTSGGN
jgi:hypothetical protein